MNLRIKVILLSTIPLIVAVSLISYVITSQANTLSRQTGDLFQDAMLEAKKSEVLNYIELALTSIDHIYSGHAEWSEAERESAKREIKQVLNGLTFGTDGYFFVYDYRGLSIVHPKQGWRVGENFWDLEDREGRKVIQELVAAAQRGGGFVRYSWEQPSKAKVEEKIGYAIALEELEWIIGTGIYIDNVLNKSSDRKEEAEKVIDLTFFWVVAITVVALGVVFASWLVINFRESRLADRRLQALTQRLVEVQEDERSRVARELHDSIGQILVGVKFTLEGARRESASFVDRAAEATGVKTSIDKAAGGLEQAIHEVRRISHGLRPPQLDDLGLGKALENLAEEFSERTKISVTTRTTVFKNLLTADAKTALYRIAQEALTNVERHSNASRAHIELSLSPGHVTLSISDNGRGFSTATSSLQRFGGGIGLRNMQERAESLGGTLKTRNMDDGAEVFVSLPNTVFAAEAAAEPLSSNSVGG